MKKLILALGLSTMMVGAMAQSTPALDTNPWQQGSWSIGAGSYKGNDKLGIAYTTAPVWTYNLDNSRINLNVEFELSKWNAGNRYNSFGYNDSMWQASINPMFNWEFNNNFFLQAGIGATRFSENYFADKQFGSKLNFSDNIGVGYRFSPNTSVTYRISHYSNAGLKNPNPGIEMQQLILSHKF